jgi:acetoacetyl-CoA synthetase
MSNPTPLWTPSSPSTTPISRYRSHINTKFGLSLSTSQDLHTWSVTNPHAFWIDLWSYVGLIPPLPTTTTTAYDPSKTIRDIPRFFPDARINYAENVLSNRPASAPALISLREGDDLSLSASGTVWTWRDLREHVRRARSALVRSGVTRGQVVAAIMSNSNWTVALFLATASLGAIFSSISSEMGVEGCIARLQQVRPAVLFADSHQTYKGRRRSLREKIRRTAAALEWLVAVVVVPVGEGGDGGVGEGFVGLDEFLGRAREEDGLVFARVPFAEPMLVLYSSGTSGPPKCIVHQHGVVLQLKKIAMLHNSLTPDDVVFQYSSTSWVLWNVMNGHLAVGATLVCYDGSPLYPDASTKLRILERYRVTYFGTSPRYLLELEMSGIQPSGFDLGSLRMVTTTGATLTTEQFRWFYRAFPKSVHLSSVAGGTEICTSWVASDPAGPLYAGEMQMIALGQDVDVADAETGESIKHVSFPESYLLWVSLSFLHAANSNPLLNKTGQAGELICRSPFPSMPVYFWNDPNNEKYNEAYFSRYTNVVVWAQHDWIQFNPRTGGSQIHGRRQVLSLLPEEKKLVEASPPKQNN